MPGRAAGHVARRQVRLHRVHVAVGAAVGLGLGEAGVPALQREAFRVGPEVPVDGGRGGLQGGVGPGDTGGQRAGGGQQDVGVGVVRLGGVEDVPGRVEAGEPAAVLAVGVAAGQGVQAGGGQGTGAGHPGQVGQREHVRHARVDVQRAGLRRVDAAVGAEPPEAAVGQRGRPAELDQPAGFGLAPRPCSRLICSRLPRAWLAHGLLPFSLRLAGAARPSRAGSAGPGGPSGGAPARRDPRCAAGAARPRCVPARPGPGR